jgi:hypothetical protein
MQDCWAVQLLTGAATVDEILLTVVLVGFAVSSRAVVDAWTSPLVVVCCDCKAPGVWPVRGSHFGLLSTTAHDYSKTENRVA